VEARKKVTIARKRKLAIEPIKSRGLIPKQREIMEKSIEAAVEGKGEIGKGEE
jgi:hypothetical protein